MVRSSITSSVKTVNHMSDPERKLISAEPPVPFSRARSERSSAYEHGVPKDETFAKCDQGPKPADASHAM